MQSLTQTSPWLNENGPQRLISLNVCSPVGATIWEGRGGVAFLEEVCYCRQALEFQKTCTIRISLCPMVVPQDVSSSLLLHHFASLPADTLLTMTVIDSPPETVISK